MKPRILLDCDGVLADFCSGFLKLVNAQFGTEYTPADVTEWDIDKALGWSPERTKEAYGLVAAHAGFAAKLEPFPGAVEGVRRLAELAEIYVVTSPWWSNKTWCHDRNNWLYEHFSILAGNVIHTSAKQLVAGDMLVDDKTTTCAAWRAAWPGGIAVQWQTPHNQRDAWDGARATSWDDLLRLAGLA